MSRTLMQSRLQAINRLLSSSLARSSSSSLSKRSRSCSETATQLTGINTLWSGRCGGLQNECLFGNPRYPLVGYYLTPRPGESPESSAEFGIDGLGAKIECSAVIVAQAKLCGCSGPAIVPRCLPSGEMIDKPTIERTITPTRLCRSGPKSTTLTIWSPCFQMVVPVHRVDSQ